MRVRDLTLHRGSHTSRLARQPVALVIPCVVVLRSRYAEDWRPDVRRCRSSSIVGKHSQSDLYMLSDVCKQLITKEK
jgi:hypothetical protein